MELSVRLRAGTFTVRCDDALEAQQRLSVITEAERWLNTPFRDLQCAKGSGVDCAQFLIAQYQFAGVLGELTEEEKDLLIGHSPQWHIHSDNELYVEGLKKFCRQVESPLPGDVILWRPPRWLSHHHSNSAIVVAWPKLVIGADFQAGVVYMDPVHDVQFKVAARLHPHLFFSPWPIQKGAV